MAIQPKFSPEGLKEPVAAVKFVIWFLALLAFALTASLSCLNGTYTVYEHTTGGSFFMFVFVSLWLQMGFCLGVYMLFWENLKTNGKMWWAGEMATTGLWVFLGFISSAVWAAKVSDACGKEGKAGAAFGFLATFVLGASLWFVFKEFRDSNQATGTTIVTQTTTTVVTSDPDPAPF